MIYEVYEHKVKDTLDKYFLDETHLYKEVHLLDLTIIPHLSMKLQLAFRNQPLS